MRAAACRALPVGLAAALCLACAGGLAGRAPGSGPAGDVDIAVPSVGAAESTSGGASASGSVEVAPRSDVFRVGFWEIDLFAFERGPQTRSVRLLDFEILRLLEVGGGEGGHSFAFLEAPEVFQAFVTRSSGSTYEHRILDLQGLALFRSVRESEARSSLRVLRLPLLGDLYGHSTDGSVEKRSYLYLFRHEKEY